MPYTTKNFDSKLPITMYDASQDGFGECLLQSDQPVVFVPHSLIAEQNYAQLKKEILEICYGFKRTCLWKSNWRANGA